MNSKDLVAAKTLLAVAKKLHAEMAVEPRLLMRWMAKNLKNFADPAEMAEAAAAEFNLFEGDEIPENLFELATEVAESSSNGTQTPLRFSSALLRKMLAAYDDGEVNNLANLFKNLDKRGDRLRGLENAKVIVREYYSGEEAKIWNDVLNKLIKNEKANPKPMGISDNKDKAAKLVSLARALYAEQWSQDVDPKWRAPEGFFKKSAVAIAQGLKKNSKDLKQAMSRLNFYINRAGSNLSDGDKKRLEDAKSKLRGLY